jgi:uncharacterized protein (DUF1800 family)
MADRKAVAHLLRRATFGPTAEEVDAAEKAGYDATLTALFDTSRPDAGAAKTPLPKLTPIAQGTTREEKQKANQARNQQVRTVVTWWLDRMALAEHQLHEKLTFFWHGHWATSVQKVKSAALMLQYQQTLFSTALGDREVQLKAMLRDTALIIWLDGEKNTAKAPNENLGRELMELFTLGIGHYTEDDVKAAARALTGWQVDRTTGKARFNPKRHDDKPKTILDRTANFDADGLADILLAQPANAQFIAERLWFRYAGGKKAPADATQHADTKSMLKAIFASEEFRQTQGQLVKQPVEWLVGAHRQLGTRPSDLPSPLNQLGQQPLQPPSVGGWPADAAWLTTSATHVRLRAAQQLAGKANVDRLTAVPAAQRIDALARLLVVDAFTARTTEVLKTVANDPRKLLALGLASPEYAVM